MSIKRSRYIPIVLLSVLILLATSFSFYVVHATGIQQAKTNWDWYKNKSYITKEDYPFYFMRGRTLDNAGDRLGLNLMYGSTRPLVIYHGELPYASVNDDSGNRFKQFTGYYAEPYTDIRGDVFPYNPNYGARKTKITAADYWGFEEDSFPNSFDSGGNFESVSAIEAVNKGTVTSLRIYALTQTETGVWVRIKNLGYSFFNWTTSVTIDIFGLVVKAKNIDTTTVLEVLRLDSLNDVMVRNFIVDRITNDEGEVIGHRLSPIMLFSMALFLLAIGAFAWRWYKGKDKTTGLWSMVVTAFLALIIIGMCLAGRLTSLGSSIANIASKLLFVASNEMVGGDGDAFVTQITDEEHETELVQACEMSLIEKSYIDLQIGIQFSVNDIDELNIKNLGDTDGSRFLQYLSGLPGDFSTEDIQSQFNNNLGYYYWFAHSNAIKCSVGNRVIPNTSSDAVTDKLSSMVTYLQVNYTTGDANQKDRIKNIICGFANPDSFSGLIRVILYGIVIVLLSVVLFKYALAVLIAKITLFISLLGMSLAGPLMLTTNKKLVQTGRYIIGMLVCSFMEITVYAIFFDLILYMVSIMLSPEIVSMIVVIALLFLLWKLNPTIADKIRSLLNQAERKLNPELAQARNKLRMNMENGWKGLQRKYDESQKIVDYNENGDPIYEKREGNALSRLMHVTGNALLTDGRGHQGFFTQRHKDKIKRKEIKEGTKLARRKAAENNVNNIINTTEKEAKKTKDRVQAEIDATIEDTRKYDAEGKVTGYNTDNLSKEENDTLVKVNVAEKQIDRIKSNKEYQSLLKKKSDIEVYNHGKTADKQKKLSDEEQAKLSAFEKHLSEAEKTQSTGKQEIETSIKTRATENAFHMYGLDYSMADGKTDKEKLDNAARKQAQNNHKDELEVALKDAIHLMAEDANASDSKKIGDKTMKVNRDAVTAEAAAMLQLSQLQNGQLVSTTDNAKSEVSDIVATVERTYNGKTIRQMEKKVDHLEDEKKQAKKISDKETRKERVAGIKEQISDAKQDLKDAKKEQKTEYKEVMQEARDEFGGGMFIDAPTVVETLQAAINRKATNNVDISYAPKPTVKQNTSTPGPIPTPVPVVTPSVEVPSSEETVVQNAQETPTAQPTQQTQNVQNAQNRTTEQQTTQKPRYVNADELDRIVATPITEENITTTEPTNSIPTPSAETTAPSQQAQSPREDAQPQVQAQPQAQSQAEPKRTYATGTENDRIVATPNTSQTVKQTTTQEPQKPSSPQPTQTTEQNVQPTIQPTAQQKNVVPPVQPSVNPTPTQNVQPNVQQNSQPSVENTQRTPNVTPTGVPSEPQNREQNVSQTQQTKEQIFEHIVSDNVQQPTIHIKPATTQTPVVENVQPTVNTVPEQVVQPQPSMQQNNTQHQTVTPTPTVQPTQTVEPTVRVEQPQPTRVEQPQPARVEPTRVEPTPQATQQAAPQATPQPARETEQKPEVKPEVAQDVRVTTEQKPKTPTPQPTPQRNEQPTERVQNVDKAPEPKREQPRREEQQPRREEQRVVEPQRSEERVQRDQANAAGPGRTQDVAERKDTSNESVHASQNATPNRTQNTAQSPINQGSPLTDEHPTERSNRPQGTSIYSSVEEFNGQQPGGSQNRADQPDEFDTRSRYANIDDDESIRFIPNEPKASSDDTEGKK